MTTKIPDFIYKYESFSIQSLENLKNQVIHFGSAAKFNDPYDCAMRPGVKIPTDLEINQYFKHLEAESDNPEFLSRQFSEMSLDAKREMLIRMTKENIDKFVKIISNSRGVTCFSEKKDNLLMWSHYGGRHKGFCLEFSTAIEPFNKIKKVEYHDKFPPFDLAQMKVDHTYSVETLFCTKAIDWSYEAEWRAFHNEVGTAYCYPADSLTGIYFGPEMNKVSMEIIFLILKGQNEQVKFWRGMRSDTEFKVHFEETTYTSHLEAKRLGLC